MRVNGNGPAVARMIALPITLPLNLTAMLWTWVHNSRSRTALPNLPPHLFNDVGLTAAQAEAESLKRFWLK